MLTLLADRYAPITSSLGFLELPLNEAAEGLLTWRKRLHGRVTKHDVTGALPKLLDLLPPLIGGIRPPELLVGTQNDRWTAFFDCGLRVPAQRSGAEPGRGPGAALHRARLGRSLPDHERVAAVRGRDERQQADHQRGHPGAGPGELVGEREQQREGGDEQAWAGVEVARSQ